MHHVSDNHAAYTVQTPLNVTTTPEAGRHVRLFRNGANQAVRIPKEFELSTQDAIIRQVAGGLLLEPILTPQFPVGSIEGLLAALATMQAIPDDEPPFPNVDEGLPPLDDIVL
jgi:antitoxin VapB